MMLGSPKNINIITITALRGLHCPTYCRAQWLRGRALDFPLSGPGLEFCAAVIKPWASCSSSLSCIHECLATDSGGYVNEQGSRINCSIWIFPREVEMVSDKTGLSGK